MGLTNTLTFLAGHPMARMCPLDVVGRFARWQVASRIAPGPFAVAFAGDAQLLVQRGMGGATGSVYTGLADFAEMALLCHLLRPGNLFVDIGANVGAYTVLAAKVAGAQVVSCEPIPGTVAWLRRNVALNGIEQQVEVHECAVGASSGTVRMTATEDCTNRVTAEGNTDVDMRTLDELLGDRVPVAVKIDVEGLELEVLKGATTTLANPELRAVVIEAYGREPIAQALRAHGFEVATYDPVWRILQRPQLMAATQNSIFVRDFSYVQGLVKGAERFKVLSAMV